MEDKLYLPIRDLQFKDRVDQVRILDCVMSLGRPLLVNQGQVRGNKNILKVGLSRYYLNIGKK